MTLEQKKKYVLDKVNSDYCYKLKLIESGYTIENYIENLNDIFDADLCSKIYLIKSKQLMFLSEIENLRESVKLEEYIKFLIMMHNYIIVMGLQQSDQIKSLHQNKLNLWIVNSIYS